MIFLRQSSLDRFELFFWLSSSNPESKMLCEELFMELLWDFF